jgi:methionine synthase II (cobalamin-independent)
MSFRKRIIRRALKFGDPTRLWIVGDCGFRRTARWAAKGKLEAMVAGNEIVRRELAV